MKDNNQALIQQLDQVTKELNQVSSFNADAAKIKEDLAALSSLHKTVQDFENKVSRL